MDLKQSQGEKMQKGCEHFPLTQLDFCFTDVCVCIVL